MPLENDDSSTFPGLTAAILASARGRDKLSSDYYFTGTLADGGKVSLLVTRPCVNTKKVLTWYVCVYIGLKGNWWRIHGNSQQFAAN